MTEPWGQPPPPGPPPPPPPPPGPPVEQHVHHHHHEEEDGFFEELFDGDDHHRRSSHRPRHSGGGDVLHQRVRTRFGRTIDVGDLLAWLDFRVTELHAAVLEGERHPSRVPGSPVRMSGLDALLNTDATAFRTLTELSGRMDRIEEKLDRLLAKE
ncbi:hypothetical protein EV188_102617 [Actinomycetospora succinea]|uniref:Uncharacterized protein n=1 Tax=Actinomycetospora succinea TaxID=663603 RepID=A0A4R6VSR1_9PSEU|nr:hypothetical protein [Actinomycetospora succinea]TDQ62960.1 hypothetical protein EV188_102617 [Actinomycetospora succinea]